jgi:tyrosyl-tRNA synthetase
MSGIYEEFQQRGFLYQCTDDEQLPRILAEEKVTFYIGFDPTADSLHVGSLVPIMAMVHMQRAGHRPIAVTGGGTAMVGDPSGKTEMRQMLTKEQIQDNASHIAAQLAHFLELDGKRGLAVDNVTWLEELGYIDFLRQIGRHFSVNRMLAMESYKQRLETGLSFLEFNYMCLQAYDFLVLCKEHDCILQMGGQDQWGNIVAGLDLVRRETGRQAYGLTFPLLTDSSGAKLGKTVAGAIWLSSEKTPHFDFYQYWRNVDDADVERFLKLFTFLPVDECTRLGTLAAPAINRSKEILAYEVLRIVRGDAAAAETYLSVVQQFGSADPHGAISTSSTIAHLKATTVDNTPTLELPAVDTSDGMKLIEVLVKSGLCSSNGEARRLIVQGGARVDDVQITDPNAILAATTLGASPIVKAGKKRLVRVVLV